MSFHLDEIFSEPPARVAAIVLLLVLLGGGLAATREGELRPAGPFDPPRQSELPYLKPLPSKGDFEIWATDDYEVEALILSRERYRFDTEAKLAPVDFLLGWGPVTQEPILSEVKWSQSGRWGHYRFKGELPIEQREIARNTANTHIVPDPESPGLRRQLLRLKRGDAVRLNGYLIKVDGANGWKWKSSRSRNDTGNGACELFYVTSVEKIDTP
ncbi:MAG: hypothetical protein PWP23_22 [Candidatus Sumerlaeota bacterium]|nr:hypothetical protein [Candidatus Sumerlaeota bacterium]